MRKFKRSISKAFRVFSTNSNMPETTSGDEILPVKENIVNSTNNKKILKEKPKVYNQKENVFNKSKESINSVQIPLLSKDAIKLL